MAEFMYIDDLEQLDTDNKCLRARKYNDNSSLYELSCTAPLIYN